MNIDTIQKDLTLLEEKLGKESILDELGKIFEAILKNTIEYCFTFLNGKYKIEMIEREKEIGEGKSTYHTFTIGRLVYFWEKADMPRNISAIKNWKKCPRILNEFPFNEFVEDRNNFTHHGILIKSYKEKSYYYQICELFDNIFPDASSPKSEKKVENNIPKLDGQFFGREDEIKKILKCLSRDHRSWIISITGIGGVGKSALASECARRCHTKQELPGDINSNDISFDAYIWTSAKKRHLYGNRVNNTILPQDNLQDIIAEIIRLLSPNNAREKPEFNDQYKMALDLLNSRRVLLIIDNMESIEDDRVMTFLQDDISTMSSSTKVIVTDRRSVPNASSITLNKLTEEESIALIKERSKLGNIVLSEDNIQQISKETGGIPLAIIWSIGQIGTSDVNTVLRRLKGSYNTEVQLLEYLFDTSFANISKQSRDLLEFIAIPNSRIPGWMLAEWAKLNNEDASDAITDLLEYALICKDNNKSQVQTGGLLESTYTLLPLTKNYVVAGVSRRGNLEINRLSKIITDSILLYFKRWEPTPEWPNHETIRLVDEYHELFSWAMSNSFDRGDYKECMQIMDYIGTALGLRGYHDIRVSLAKLTIEAAQRCNEKRTVANCLVTHIGWTYFDHWHNYEECLQEVTQGMRIATEIQDMRILGISKRTLGLIQKEKKEFVRAKELLLEALSLFQKANNTHFLAITQGSLASLSRETGDYDEAESFLEKAIETSENLKNIEVIRSVFLQKHAKILIARGGKANLERATSLNEEAEFLSKKIGRQLGIAYSKLISAKIAKENNDHKLAGEYADDAESLFVQSGSKDDIVDELSAIREWIYVTTQPPQRRP